MSNAKTLSIGDRVLERTIEENLFLGGSPENAWHLDRYKAYAHGLFERSPIKKGARVRLLRAPDIGPNSGWRHAKHILVKGALATIDDVDFGERGFKAGLLFDDETWIPHDAPNERRPVDRRGQYWFGESWFEVLVDGDAPMESA